MKKPTVHSGPQRISLSQLVKSQGRPVGKAPCKTCAKARKALGIK